MIEGTAVHRLAGGHAALVVAEAGFVMGEEDLADKVTRAPNAVPGRTASFVLFAIALDIPPLAEAGPRVLAAPAQAR